MRRALVWMLLGASVLIVAPTVVGCRSHAAVQHAVSRPDYLKYRRVAVVGRLQRTQEEFLIPLYMQAFPSQAMVERRDLESALGEQDLLKDADRLDAETRAQVRELLGVDALVFASYTGGKWPQMSLKTIDTRTGEIVAAVLTTPNPRPPRWREPVDYALIRAAVAALHDQVYR